MLNFDNLKEQFKSLESLQEIDLKIDTLKKKKATAPSQLKQIDDQFNRSQSGLNQKKSLIIELEKSIRQTKTAIELNSERLTRAHSKLEQVHNTHEFQAANKEIDQLKKMNTQLEEQMAKVNKDLETHQSELQSIEQSFKDIESKRNEISDKVKGEFQIFDTEIGALVSSRQAFIKNVDQKILNQYDRVRGAKMGIGIAPAVSGRCNACHMMVPPQMFNDLHRFKTLHSCPSCHRLLYIPEAPGSNPTNGN